MPRIFITGSSDGLGLAVARDVLDNGQAVVVHARNERRAADLRQRLPAADAVLVGDLASRTETLRLACRANELGTFDAVIHNAGIGYRESRRIATPEGHAHMLAINVLARALARRPGFAGTVSRAASPVGRCRICCLPCAASVVMSAHPVLGPTRQERYRWSARGRTERHSCGGR